MFEFLQAVCLVLVIEGLAYALFPRPLRRMMAQVIATPEEQLRAFGLLAAVLGVAALWLVRGG